MRGVTGRAVRVWAFGWLAALLVAAPVSAQTPAPTAATPKASRAHLGGVFGIASVARSEPALGMGFGLRVRRNLHLVVEAARFGDVVTQSRIDEVNSYGAYLAQTQARPASGHIDAPAHFAMVGAQMIPDRGWDGVRPYVVATVGLAKVEYRPTFVLDGLNKGPHIADYGVTIGRDLLGPAYRVAFSGGAGVVFGERWYLDLGFRLMRINTIEDGTTVRWVHVGFGRRF